MDTSGKIQLLKKHFLFQNLSSEEIEKIAEIAKEREIPARTVFIRQDERGDEAYFIVSGLVDVYRVDTEGKQVHLTIKGVGDVVGEMAIIDEEPRSAYVETMQETKVLILTKQDFLTLLENYPTIAIRLLSILSQKIRENVELIEQLNTKNLPERTLSIIKLLAPHFTNETITLSQEELATLIGATRARVTESLQQLKEQGRIALDHKKITLL